MLDKLTKEQKQILAGLFSSKEDEALNSIGHIRNTGGHYTIKPMMEIYFSTPYKSVEESINQLFSDSKDDSISDLILEVIEKYKTKQNFQGFISALWQSSIKFTTLLPFLNIFDLADDLLAVEVFSVVENNAEYLSREEMSNCKAFLNAKINTYKDFKKNLATEMIKLF